MGAVRAAARPVDLGLHGRQGQGGELVPADLQPEDRLLRPVMCAMDRTEQRLAALPAGSHLHVT